MPEPESAGEKRMQVHHSDFLQTGMPRRPAEPANIEGQQSLHSSSQPFDEVGSMGKRITTVEPCMEDLEELFENPNPPCS